MEQTANSLIMPELDFNYLSSASVASGARNTSNQLGPSPAPAKPRKLRIARLARLDNDTKVIPLHRVERARVLNERFRCALMKVNVRGVGTTPAIHLNVIIGLCGQCYLSSMALALPCHYPAPPVHAHPRFGRPAVLVEQPRRVSMPVRVPMLRPMPDAHCTHKKHSDRCPFRCPPITHWSLAPRGVPRHPATLPTLSAPRPRCPAPSLPRMSSRGCTTMATWSKRTSCTQLSRVSLRSGLTLWTRTAAGRWSTTSCWQPSRWAAADPQIPMNVPVSNGRGWVKGQWR